MSTQLAALLLLAITIALPGIQCIRTKRAASLSTDPEPPTWPSSYSLYYTFSLPYTGEVQRDMVRYDVALFRDNHPRVRMETLNGTNVLIASKGVQYELTPRLDVQVCRVFEGGDEADATAETTGLPDLTDWQYMGGAQLNGQSANVWRYFQQHEAKTVEYMFHASLEGTPLRLHVLGNDLFSGAHYGECGGINIKYAPRIYYALLSGSFLSSHLYLY